MSYPGKYLIIDGADGCGKTTHVYLLEEYLKEKGYDVVVTREPGGTELGEKIRAILRDPSLKGMDVNAECFLFFASRSQSIPKIVVPAVQEGKIAIGDRSFLATLAYQGYAGGGNKNLIKSIINYLLSKNKLSIDGGIIIVPKDDKKLLEELLKEDKKEDRFHQKSVDYHRIVNAAYIEIAKEYNLKIIPYKKGDIQGMQQQIRKYIDSILEQ